MACQTHTHTHSYGKQNDLNISNAKSDVIRLGSERHCDLQRYKVINTLDII